MRNLEPSEEERLQKYYPFLMLTSTGHSWHLPRGPESVRTCCGFEWVEFWTWAYVDPGHHLCEACLRGVAL